MRVIWLGSTYATTPARRKRAAAPAPCLPFLPVFPSRFPLLPATKCRCWRRPGSVITLFATAATVPSNGSMEIVATVIEQGTASTTTPGPTVAPARAPERRRPLHLAPALRCTTARWLPLRRRSGELSRARRAPTTGRSASGSTPTARAGPRSSPHSRAARPGSSRTSRSDPAGAERILLSANPRRWRARVATAQVFRKGGRRQRRRAPAGPGGLHHHEGTTQSRRPPRQTRAERQTRRCRRARKQP